MSVNDDLVTWLRAQLDDDVRLIDEYEAYMTERAAAAGSYVLVTPPGWQPGEPFDPDRQRAEVDAKRRVVELHRPIRVRSTGSGGGTVEDCRICDQFPAQYPCGTMRALALPYADRPGYHEEWRPSA